MLTERFFESDGVRINYAEGPPSGSPLVLLHGGGARWQTFLPVIAALSLRWKVYALDARGHGKSGWRHKDWHVEDLFADTSRFLQSIVTYPAVIFGHSWGGYDAIWQAAQLPEMVKALVIGDAPLSIGDLAAMNEKAKGYWASLMELAGSGYTVAQVADELAEIEVPSPDDGTPLRYADLPDVDSVQIRYWAKTVSQLQPEALAFLVDGCTMEVFENYIVENLLSTISCPVLLLQAEAAFGGLMTDQDVERAKSMLSDVAHVLLQRTGHDLGLRSWQVGPLLRAVMGFLESL
jgi:pimeloyl-ACP methyl ester carboxylesterase